MKYFITTLLCITAFSNQTNCSSTLQPRNVRIIDKNWVDINTGKNIILKGPNVVVKGPPWLPLVEGNTICNDTSTITCKTFNEADAIHITKTMGWNSIRLGITWAGGQPIDSTTLNPIWVKNLHQILTLTDKYNINVILDHHTDMVGSANCGFGVPMWFSKKASPNLIGKELETASPFKYMKEFTSMFTLNKPKQCINNRSAWLENKDDNNYNLVNSCCKGMNSWANNNALGFTTLAQETLGYLFKKGDGRDYYCNYFKLLSKELVQHPSAIAIELMNEPVYIERWNMYDTWKQCNDEIISVIPDMNVAVADVGEGAVLPSWLGPNVALSPSITEWLKTSRNLFYAWHWYGNPKDPLEAIKNVQKIQDKWNMPSMLTETMSCDAMTKAEKAGISWSYWHYSQYCDTAPAYGGKLPPYSFGACILGWGDGQSNKRC